MAEKLKIRYGKNKTISVRVKGRLDPIFIFVSMSGFTDGAVGNAREIGKKHTIILMDGDDINSIFKGQNRFELVLQQKIDFFQRNGNPYVSQSDVTQPAN